MKTQDKRLRFVELRAAGWSFSKIATELSVSKSTLVEWSRDLAEDIANLRVVETDALIEASRIGHENRVLSMSPLERRYFYDYMLFKAGISSGLEPIRDQKANGWDQSTNAIL